MRQLTPQELSKLEELSGDTLTVPKFSWSGDFQRKLLALFLLDQYMLVQAIDLVKPEYFSNEAHVLITKILFKYFHEHKFIPEKFIVEQELTDKLKDRDKSIVLHYMAELNVIYNYYVPGLDTREYLIEKITYFAKVQSLKIAFHSSLEKVQEAPEDENTWSFVYEQMRNVMTIDKSYEPGFEYFMNLEEMFKRMESINDGKDRFTTAFPSIDSSLTGGGLFPGQIGAWIASSGAGKCFLRETKVLMFDGSIKNVEDIVVGDVVMGNDSTPRNVLSTHNFFDNVYEIKPTKGDSYFVNSKHILSLRNGLEIINISVEDYLGQSEEYKDKMKGWRAPLVGESYNVGIKVIKTDRYEEFFGFETDGNHLFLLEDFTVVHNSLCLTKAAVSNIMLGHKVLYLTMELNELEVAQRFTSQFMKFDINNLKGVKDEIIKTAEDFKNQYDDPNLLHVKQFPGGIIDMNGIRSYLAQLEFRKWKPNLLIVDYVGEMKDDPNLKKYESAYRIVRDLRGLSVEKQYCTLTCLQANVSATKLEIGEYINESNIGVAYDQCKPLDALWSLNQQVIEKDASVGRAFVIKHRNGRSKFPFRIGFDYDLGTLDVSEISKETYRERMNLVQEKKAAEINIDGTVKSKKFKGDNIQVDANEEE